MNFRHALLKVIGLTITFIGGLFVWHGVISNSTFIIVGIILALIGLLVLCKK